MDFEPVFKIVELAIIVVALFLIHNSFPASKVKELIELLKTETEKTETPVDDLLLQVVELLNALRAKESSSSGGESATGT